MGTLALAAKITHVPSMYLSELPGPHQGCRQAAIDGHIEIGRRCRALGVDTIVVFDVHWLVNADYHVNCAPRFSGVYTSNELPHFIKNMPYDYPGNPALGQSIGETATEAGIKTRWHAATTLDLEYGTLVPMRYMNADRHFKVVSIAAWCMWHELADSIRFGAAVRRAVEDRYDGTVAILASGSLSHHFADNGRGEEFLHKTYNEFLLQTDLAVVEMWKRAEWARFLAMLPMYNDKCWGEGGMHDTAMLLGAMGGERYDQGVEIITPYFGSSGTGQINAIFPGFLTMLSHEIIVSLARTLYDARRRRVQLRHFSQAHPAMTVADGYSIQREWVKLELADGRTIKGRKIGLTSRAMQQASQIAEPDFAPLMDDMFFPPGDIPIDRFIAPRVEVELAFVLARPLAGEGVTLEDVLAATERVVPAVEIIDARIEQFDRETKAPRKVFDTIADFAANAGVVLGAASARPGDVDLRWVGAILERNGIVEETGLAAGVLNHPATGVAWLAQKIAPYDESLEAGDVILAGSFTRPVNAVRGDRFRADYGPLGVIEFRFV